MPKYRKVEAVTTYQDKRNAKIYELANKGVNLIDLGKLYGISRQRIKQIVNRQEELVEAGVERTLSQRD